jgi:hypothetical protein
LRGRPFDDLAIARRLLADVPSVDVLNVFRVRSVFRRGVRPPIVAATGADEARALERARPTRNAPMAARHPAPAPRLHPSHPRESQSDPAEPSQSDPAEPWKPPHVPISTGYAPLTPGDSCARLREGVEGTLSGICETFWESARGAARPTRTGRASSDTERCQLGHCSERGDRLPHPRRVTVALQWVTNHHPG